MQGRLSPRTGGRRQAFPWGAWQEEFALAGELGLDCIEWLVTADRLGDNPIWTHAGVEAIRERMAATGVRVTSLCADCFIARPFVRVDDTARRASVSMLVALIEQCAQAGIEVLVVPALEAGAISDRTEASVLVDALRAPQAFARSRGVRLAIESDLPADRYREMLDAVSPPFGAAFDVGNATASGYDAGADLRELARRLSAIHIKDRRRAGPSVPLGEGDTDFDAVFDGVIAAGYAGPLILETPVGDDPATSARRHLAFVRDSLRTREAGGVGR